uniref:Ig-like domain-containing protein n=1 Tax=Scophthalmus maximus TaxID=52904 RepID=A0A8D3CAZ8_SCOMX
LSVIFLFFHPDHLSAVIQSAAVEQDTGVASAGVGDNVTLVYKHEKLATVSKWLVEITRFSVQREEGANHLQISDVHLSNSATYFCGSSHSNMVEFGEGVFLSEPQEPESVTVLPGGSVTLKCTVNTGTCDGEHSVYWFRHGSRLGIIHAHGDQCHRVSAPAGSPSHSCVYHLQRMNLTSLDAGTYNCVLVTDDTEDCTAQMRILVWLSIFRAAILVLFLTGCLSVYSTKSRQPPLS